MKTIRFAICGAGRRGLCLTRDIIINLDDVEVCGISDPYRDKAEELARIIKKKRL